LFLIFNISKVISFLNHEEDYELVTTGPYYLSYLSVKYLEVFIILWQNFFTKKVGSSGGDN